MQKIIITGGSGYIGSHTVVEFINAGFKAVIIDNLYNSSIKVVDNIEKITGVRPDFYNVDVTDRTKLAEVFEANKDAVGVVHFAAYKAVGESVQEPLKYYWNNLLGLINVLDLMKEKNIPNLVFSSSCTVYGQPDKLPVTEETPKAQAESPYGNTKKISEDIIVDTLKSCQSLKAIALRYFNPIGAHPSALIGELPNGIPNNLLPYITQTARGLRSCLKVFGNDYNTSDGTPIRDYINVVDLAKAHVAAVKYILKPETPQFDYFNLGTGVGNTVLEVINSFERSTGVKINYEIVGRRAGDIEKVWADTSKANRLLGWHAEISLDDTMKSAWAWEKNLMKNN